MRFAQSALQLLILSLVAAGCSLRCVGLLLNWSFSLFRIVFVSHCSFSRSHSAVCVCCLFLFSLLVALLLLALAIDA